MKYDNEKYVGQKYNHLTVIKYEKQKFYCKCDCGRHIWAFPTYVIRGTKKTCSQNDCVFYKEVKSLMPNRKHGLSHTRLYSIWHNMISRCYSPKNPNYIYYGQRGIQVCESWSNNVEDFFKWAHQNGYAENLSIDRINNDGNYEPNNCRWVSSSVQNSNKRRGENKKPNHLKYIWTINGVSKNAVDWCKEYGIDYSTVLYRVRKRSMTPIEALTIKPRGNKNG